VTDERRIRVLVVDDSAFARKVLRETLSRDPRLEVIGTARDGLEALEKIAESRPDVITLDLVMPNLDGLGVLRALPREDAPRAVVVSISDADSALGVEALQSGAVDLVHKPTPLATDRLYDLGGELVAKVVGAASAHPAVGRPSTNPASRGAPLPAFGSSSVKLVVIGTSTGGPQALTRLLSALPRDLPCAVAVALHIPAGYTEALARRLDESSPINVVEAIDGASLAPGTVAIARGGTHLRVTAHDGAIVTHLDSKPIAPFCPSVDLLFKSAAEALGPAVLGVVLTGMGADGVEGARAIHDAGGRVLTETESSCVVYGMPRAVVEADLSDANADIDKMADAIFRHL
jgi:two-component system chemotaxis response regulator CheB